LCPGLGEKQGIYRVTLTGQVRILSWWDRTGDPRGQSNSNLLGYGFSDHREMIEQAKKQFPKIMARQTTLEPESL
jgi:hypothetical protein